MDGKSLRVEYLGVLSCPSPARIDTFAANKMIEMHGKRGNIHLSLQIFRELGISRDSFSWDLMLLAALRNDRLELVTELFAAMPTLTPYSCSAMITAFADAGDLREARLLFDRFPGKNLVIWTVMLEALSRNGDHPEARRLFDAMPLRDLYAWNTVLVAYAEAGHIFELEAFFRDIPEMSIISCTVLLKAMSAKSSSAKPVVRFFNQMPHRDQACQNAVLDAIAMSGGANLAENFHDFSCPGHDLVSWNTLLAAYARSGNLSEARRIFDKMPERSMASWNSMLGAYAAAGHLEESRVLFSRMPLHAIQSATTLLAACRRPAHLQTARDILLGVPVVDLISCNAMAAALSNAGALEEAQHFQDSAMPFLDSSSCTSMLVAYAQHGHLHECLRVFHAMPYRDPASWTAMLGAYAQEGHLNLVKGTFDKMPRRCVISCTAMLNSCVLGGQFQLALEVFYESNLVAVIQDEACFTPVLAASAGSVALSKRCFVSMMLDHDLDATRHHYSCMLGALSRAGHLIDARDLLENMPFVPGALEWRCFLSSCVCHNELANGAFAAAHILLVCRRDATAYTLLANIVPGSPNPRCTASVEHAPRPYP